jgi:hypothetical protein
MDDLKEQIKITLEAGLELHLEPLKKAQDEKSVAIKVLTQRIDYLQNLANIFTVSQQVGLLNSDHYQEKYNLMIEFLLSPTTTSTIYDRSRPDQKFEHLLHKLYGCVDKNGMWLDPNQILNALQELGSTKEHAKAIKALFAQGWPLYNHTIEAAYTRGAAVGVFNAITSVEENLRPPTEIVYSHVASFLSRYDGAMLAQVCRSGRASAHAEQDGVIKAIRNEAQAPEEAELAPSQPRRNSRG